jgi:hypothetical protein
MSLRECFWDVVISEKFVRQAGRENSLEKS